MTRNDRDAAFEAIRRADLVPREIAERWVESPNATMVRERLLRDPVVTLLPDRRVRRRWPVAIVASAALIFLGLVATMNRESDVRIQAAAPAPLDIALGRGHLWGPPPSSDNSPEQAASSFASDVLGWFGPVDLAEPSATGGPVIVSVSDGQGRALPLLMVPNEGGWVVQAIQRTAPTLELDGVQTVVRAANHPSEATSVAISFLTADGTHHLSSGTELEVVRLDVSLRDVATLLIRYLADDGTVIGATGTTYSEP